MQSLNGIVAFCNTKIGSSKNKVRRHIYSNIRGYAKKSSNSLDVIEILRTAKTRLTCPECPQRDSEATQMKLAIIDELVTFIKG